MKFFRKHSRLLSAFIGLNLLAEWWFPNLAFALTSGPSQPEVQSFQPIGTLQPCVHVRPVQGIPDRQQRRTAENRGLGCELGSQKL